MGRATDTSAFVFTPGVQTKGTSLTSAFLEEPEQKWGELSDEIVT